MSCCCNELKDDGFLNAEGLHWYSSLVKNELDKLDRRIMSIGNDGINSAVISFENGELVFKFTDGTSLSVHIVGGGNVAADFATIQDIDNIFEGRL